MEMGSEVAGLRTLTIKQLAEASGIQTWRLYSEIAAGKGPRHFRVGKTIRIRVKDADEWMDTQSNQGGVRC